MSDNRQDELRQSRLRLSLGDDKVAFERMDAMEGLSTPFTAIVDVRADLEIDLYPHIGETATVEIHEDSRSQRYFHGVLVAAEHVSQSEAGVQYRLTLRPFLHWMSYNRDMAIFQEQTAPDIIKQVFGKRGFSDIEWKLTQKYHKRHYCVQYRESDFAFISRLMEEEGIYYFFRHERDRHVMVICDGPSAHGMVPLHTLHFVPTSVSVFSTDSAARAGAGKYRLQSWKERVSSGGEQLVTLADFEPTLSALKFARRHEFGTGHRGKGVEVYDYSGRWASEDDPEHTELGNRLSRARLDLAIAERRVFTGTTQASDLALGTLVEIAEHPTPRLNGKYLITSTMHAIAAETYRSGRKEQERSFNVRFEAIKADIGYRPPIVTPKPSVQGLESAIVTGPKGETIYTDKLGRVKVQFHWDRQGKMDDTSTCWIRVSQTGLLGNQILPRVGHEVLVDFLQGDPDKPVVVGRVYNAANMPYYELPKEKTKAVWRTLSYPTGGGGTSIPGAMKLDTGDPQANELRFEDKHDHEEVFIHAQRDMNIRVRYNETHHVGHDEFTKIGRNRQAIVQADEKLDVGGNRTDTVTGDDTTEIKKNQKLTIKMNRETKITGKEERKVDATYKLEVKTGIDIICGGSKIKITPWSIEMESLVFKVNGQIHTEIKGLLTTVQAGAIMTVKGGITMIN